MATTSPARIDDDLYSSAKLVGETQSRSASQQVAHWARIGREIEASGTISSRDIASVLAGSRSYDELTAREQAVVRAEWSERAERYRSELDFAEELAGVGYVEADEGGQVVRRQGRVTPVTPVTPGASGASGASGVGDRPGVVAGSRPAR